MRKASKRAIAEWRKLYRETWATAAQAMSEETPEASSPGGEQAKAGMVTRFADLVADEVVRLRIRTQLG